MEQHARVPIPDIEAATGEARRFFDASAQMRGRVPNSSRMWGGYIPYIARLHLAASVPMHREGAGGVLSAKIKEMAVLKTSFVNTCNY